MRRCLTPFATLVCLSQLVFAQGSSPLSHLSLADWQSDLATLDSAIRATRPQLYVSVRKDLYDRAVAAARDELTRVQPTQRPLVLARLVGMLGDAHSQIFVFPSTALGTTGLPVRFQHFADGWRVSAAAPNVTDLFGRRVTAIGDVPIDSLVARLAGFVGFENLGALQLRAPLLLATTEALQLAGVHTSGGVAITTQNDAGVTQRQLLTPLAPTGNAFAVPSDWRAARPTGHTLTARDTPYWIESLADSILYLRLDEIGRRGPQGGSIGAPFALDSALQRCAAERCAKMVIDLRFNGGGDNSLRVAMLRSIVHAQEVDRRGRLFVLIGSRTASAAQNVADVWDTYTNAIFVGEPSGQRPNHFGDSRTITLPKTGIVARIASLYHQYGTAGDSRDALTPEISAPITWAAWNGGADPAIVAVRNWDPTRQAPNYSGNYATRVSVIENACGAVTTMDLPTVVSHDASRGTLALTHGGTTYRGILDGDGAFITRPESLTFNGFQYVIGITGRMRRDAFEATVTLDRLTLSSKARCRYVVRWLATKE